MHNIAFLGLGAMGLRMAQRLINAGHTVTVYNRTAKRAQRLATSGARVAKTAAEAAAEADIVISMVTNTEASKAVWLTPATGALSRIKPTATVIESSTLTPAWIAHLHTHVTKTGASFLDAPVVGTRPHAEAGKLTYLVGGKAKTLDKTRALLLTMGSAIHHVGDVGRGTTMKLMVNALFGIQVAALAEILGMAHKSGIATQDAVHILNQMGITSPSLAIIGNLIAAQKFAPMFPIDLVEKDFGYVMDAATQVDAKTPTTAAVRKVYKNAIDADLGEHNINAIAQLYM